MAFIDTHTHLNFAAFATDRDQIITSALSESVTAMIVVGTQPATSQTAIDLATTYPELFAAVGIHPHHAQALPTRDLFNQQLDQIATLARHPKVVAIGEIGLDNHHFTQTKYTKPFTSTTWTSLSELQLELFTTQLDLAQSLRLPVIIHSREVGQTILPILKDFPDLTGVFHCFEGGRRFAKNVLNAGFYLSFTGNITYAGDRAQVLHYIPLDRLLLETDSPYIVPEPLRTDPTITRNLPQYALHTATFIASTINQPLETVLTQTTQNAISLFNLNSLK